MTTYRVIGARTQTFWVDVTADNKDEAYSKADLFNSVDWIEIETDNVIEVIDALENIDE